MTSLLKPFYQIWTEPPHQWHPLLVHFPIVFLALEAVFLVLFRYSRDASHDRWALLFLYWAATSMLVVALAGLHDSGLNLGPGNKFWLGLQDRWHNAFRFQSSITVHVWLTLSLMAVTALRLVWRARLGSAVLRGRQGWAFAFATVLSLWMLFVAGYVGGRISHG
jgi:hypothetical protein